VVDPAPKRTAKRDQPDRIWLSVEVTALMKEAVRKSARKKIISVSQLLRMWISEHTDYDESADPDVDRLLRMKPGDAAE